MKSRRGSAVALILFGLCLSATGQDNGGSVYPIVPTPSLPKMYTNGSLDSKDQVKKRP